MVGQKTSAKKIGIRIRFKARTSDNSVLPPKRIHEKIQRGEKGQLKFRSTGKAPGTLIRKSILLEAKRLLLQTSLSVAEIAYAPTFKDNLCNLQLNLFSVFAVNGEISGISRARPSSLRFSAPGRDVKNTEGWLRRSLANSARRAEQTLGRLNVSPESAPQTFLRLCTCVKAVPY